MVYTRERDHYDVRLAGSLLKACENGTADFLNSMTVPYYTQDMVTKMALSDAGQLQTLLNNSARGNQYINYAPTYIIQDSKTEWMKNIDRNDNQVGSIIYKGKDENGNKHYEMMTPAGKFNPGGINESPMTQNPVPNIGIYRQPLSFDPRDPNGIEKYISGVIGNYFNAAFTKTPYFAPQWGAPETEMLSRAINADPSIALRAAQQAYAQATSVKMDNVVNHELNNNVMEAIKQGLPPFNTQKQNTIAGPVNGSGVPANGVDFMNSYYNSVKGNSGVSQGNAAGAQNGYIPYQTHEVKPRSIDKFLVEQYGNIMNASLTGTPYSGSVTPAQLKNLAAGIETKMTKNPAYMSGIVNQAQQNVLGFNYLPYNKEDFINRARDPSSKEFKLLDKMITNHVNDICKKNKQSFNVEFQKLSKDLIEKLKNMDAAKTEKKPSTVTPGKDGNISADAGVERETGRPPAGTSAAKETKSPPTRTPPTETPPPRASAAKERPSAVTSTEILGERHSFIKEASEFVRKNIVEKSTALTLADTFLGAVIDKARKVFYTKKNVAASFAIASNVVAPNLQLTVTAQLGKAPAANMVTASVNHNDNKPAARGPVKAGPVKPEPVKAGPDKPESVKAGTVKAGTAKADEHIQQKQQTRTPARTSARR